MRQQGYVADPDRKVEDATKVPAFTQAHVDYVRGMATVNAKDQSTNVNDIINLVCGFHVVVGVHRVADHLQSLVDEATERLTS